MSVSGGIIVSPENLTADVAATLGVSSAKVGYLCSNQHGKTNMWSRKKPVHILNTDSPDRTSEWWRGTLNDCGITEKLIPFYGSDLKPILDDSDELNGWTYRPPSGGSVSPYRLADFIGYDHNASPPFRNFNVASEILEGGTIIGTCLMTSGTGGSLTLDDINVGGKRLSECKLGMVIFDGRGNRKGSVIGDSIGAVEFNVSSLSKGITYYAYPFLAHNSKAQNELDVVNSYFTIPYTTGKSFKVVGKEEFYGLRVTINAIENLGMVSYTVIIFCKKAGVNIYYGGLELRFSDSDPNDALIIGEWAKNIDPVFIEADVPYEISGNAPATGGVEEHPGYVFRVHLNTSLGVIDREVSILEQMAPNQ